LKNLSPKQNKVHIIGIGGIGTSALARWFLSHSYDVSGSDLNASAITSDLKKLSVSIFIGHKAKNVSHGLNLAIFSAAVPIDNPERQEALKLGIPLQSYSEAVGDLTEQYKTLAISGAHGKSTTTALLSLILIKAGFDPTVIIGTKLKEFANSNFRNGKGDYLILEADEYNKSFLNYSPFAAIILNIDREHLDCYKDLTEIKNTFLKFINNIQPNGILVANKDDKNLFSLKNEIQKIVKKNNLHLFWYSIRVNQRIYQHLFASLKISGEHNISNALAAYTLAKALKIKDKNIFSAITSYRGAWRRMEYRGNLKSQISNLKIPVYDDYAHHPTEIKATLAGIAQKSPKTAIICVFQPHQVKRLAMLFNEFIGAFDEAYALVLLPIYQVAGRDFSAPLRAGNAGNVSQNVNSEKLAEVIKNRINKLKTKKLKAVVYLPHPEKLRSVLTDLIIRNSQHLHSFADWHYVIVMMGAGDIYKMTDKLLA